MTRREFARLAVLCAIAALVRLWGLGSLGLVVDEGVQGLAVQGWLGSGLPILPSGIMYRRAIPFGALQALSSWTFGTDEFALRLPAALFGIGAVLATFALARALFDRRVAWIAAIFIALSAWEIELSRYARFYTAFQVSYALALLCFFRGLAPGARAWRWGFAASAFAAITFHELGIVLVTCFLVPLFDRAASTRTRVTVLAGAIPFVGVWLVYRRGLVPWFAGLAPLHGLEQLPYVAPEGADTLPWLTGFPPLRIPGFSAMQDFLVLERLALLASIAIAVVATVLVLRQHAGVGRGRGVFLILAMALGVMHQFVAAGLALVIHMALSATTLRALWSRQYLPVLAALTLMLAFWTVGLFGRLDGDLKALTLSLFGFPNVLQHFVYWFALGWPVFLIVISVAAAVMFDRFLRNGDRAMLFLLVGIVAPMSAASMFDSYFESRYVFHLYPLLAIVFVWGMLQIADRLAAMTMRGRASKSAMTGAALALGLISSGDIGPPTWAPMTRTYASQRDPMRGTISWRAYAGFHQDQIGPARFVRERVGEGDVVAAIGLPHQLAVYRFYTGRLDVALSRPQDRNYQRLRNGRIVDWVTGSELVFNPKELVPPSRAGTTWLIGDDVLLGEAVDYFPDQVKRDAQAVAKDAVFRGRDGVSFVVRLP